MTMTVETSRPSSVDDSDFVGVRTRTGTNTRAQLEVVHRTSVVVGVFARIRRSANSFRPSRRIEELTEKISSSPKNRKIDDQEVFKNAKLQRKGFSRIYLCPSTSSFFSFLSSSR